MAVSLRLHMDFIIMVKNSLGDIVPFISGGKIANKIEWTQDYMELLNKLNQLSNKQLESLLKTFNITRKIREDNKYANADDRWCAMYEVIENQPLNMIDNYLTKNGIFYRKNSNEFFMLYKQQEFPTIFLELQKKGYNLVVVDGDKMSEAHEIFAEFKEKLKFPEYFGGNWDAFNDCVSDLMWLDEKKTVILIKNWDKFYGEAVRTFLPEILLRAHEGFRVDGIEFLIYVFEK